MRNETSDMGQVDTQYMWAPMSDVFTDPMSQNVILAAAASLVLGMVYVVANYAGELSRWFLSW